MMVGLDTGYFVPVNWRTNRKSSYEVCFSFLTDEEVRIYIGMLDGLAFLPVVDVVQGMAYLRGILPDQALLPVVDSFDRTYVNGTVRPNGQVTPPRYPPHEWNNHEITLNDRDRTNNICEGWNNAFGHLIGK